MSDDNTFDTEIEDNLPTPSADFPTSNEPSFSDDDFSVDFTGVDAMGAGFEAKPPGWYKVRVTKLSKTATKNAGKLPADTPGINVEFTVAWGPNSSDEVKYEGQKLWSNYWLHPNNIGFLKGLLKATEQFTEEELNGPLQAGWQTRLMDAELMVKNTNRTYQGENRDNVSGVKSVREYQEGKQGGGDAADLMPGV